MMSARALCCASSRGGGDEANAGHEYGDDMQPGHYVVAVTTVLRSASRVFERHHDVTGTANCSWDVRALFPW